MRDVLDRVIVRVEREIQREADAGCKRGSHCAREAFRERCKQWDVFAGTPFRRSDASSGTAIT